MITNDQKIIQETDIVDFIGNFVDLKKQGTSYKGLCPFHNEKTPSFTVTKANGRYHCFGCGRGGDAANFIRDIKNFDYPEAIEYIASFNGTEVEYKKGKDVSKWNAAKQEAKIRREELKPVIAMVWDYFRSNITKLKVENKDSDKPLIGFMGRAFYKETLDKFGYGVAPKAGLIKYIEEKGLPISPLVDLGLVYQKFNPDNTLYSQSEQFENRHILPLKSHSGVVVGFAGRRTDKKKEKKYINSADSVVYNKSEILFGYSENRKAISVAGEVILMEGYTDVMTATEHGFDNSLGKSGTALTIQQAKEIKRITNKVIVCGDCDPNGAGENASFRDIEILLKVGLTPRIVIWPKRTKEMDPKNLPPLVALLEKTPKMDTDALLRTEKGHSMFKQLIKDAKYGLVALVMRNVDKTDLHDLGEAINLAAKLLFNVKDDINRNLYLERICQLKNLGNVKRKIQGKINELQNQVLRLAPSSTGLDAVQTQDLNTYGIFIRKTDNGQVFAKAGGSNEKGYIHQLPIANFVLHPLYFVADRDNPTEMMTIVNKQGESTIIEVPTDSFCELGAFRKFICRFGNYQLYGSCKANDFFAMAGFVKDRLPKVYKITTLGYHKSGFFTWINGISVDGTFYPGLFSGLVQHKTSQYILPGITFKNEGDENYDDDDKESEYLDLYRYKETDIPFIDYLSQFLKVHGENGLVGLAYYFACCFQDIIYKENNSFPHLNLYGPKGKGKSTMAWSLNYFFGSPRSPVIFDNFTKPGVLARGRQIRNAILWIDELQNHKEQWRIGFVRGLYDGTGKEKRNVNAGSSKATQNERIYNGVLLSGQASTIFETAVYERCVVLDFNYTASDEGYENFKKLKQLEKKNGGTAYTQLIQSFRHKFTEEYSRMYDECKSILQQNVKVEASDRIIQNHCVILTAAALIAEEIELPKITKKFKKMVKGKEVIEYKDIGFTTALADKLSEQITYQSLTMSKSDELGEFWRIFRLLINNKRKSSNYLENDYDFSVEEHNSVTVKVAGTKSQTESITLPPKTKVLFVHIDTAYAGYAQQLGSERSNKRTMSAVDIRSYLNSANYFIGTVRGKRLHKREGSTSFAAIDLKKLGDFDLPLSIDMRNKDDDFPSADCPDTGKPRGKCNCQDCKDDRAATAGAGGN